MSRSTSSIGCLAILSVIGCSAATPRPAPPTPPAPSPPAPGPEWAPLGALIGAWAGSGGDAAHPSHGGFTVAPDLGGKVLVRRSINDTATAHHEDLTVMYHAPGGALQASYFDNEGHTIHYAITPSADGRSILFLGDEVPGAPRFRLTYDAVADGTLAVTFDVAPPGSTQFQTYVKGEVHRTGGGVGGGGGG